MIIKFDTKAGGHDFESIYISNANANTNCRYKDYKCIKCGLVAFAVGMTSYSYYENYLSNKPVDLLSCDEMIVKNILE